MIEETRTLVITARSSAPGSNLSTRLYSYGMIGDDKLYLVDHDPPGVLGFFTFHLERMEA